MAVSGEPLGLAIHRKLLFAPAKINLLQFMLTATFTDFGKLRSSKSKRGCLTKKGEIALKICTQKAAKVWKLSGFCGIIDV